MSSESDTKSASTLPDDVLIILAVKDVVLFPRAVSYIAVGRPPSLAAAQEAITHRRRLGLLLQRDEHNENPGPQDLYSIGTVATVIRHMEAPDGMLHLLCRGEQRFRVVDFLHGLPFTAVRYQLIAEPESSDASIEARVIYLKQQALEAVEALSQTPPEFPSALKKIDSPAALADFVAGVFDFKPEHKQLVLETVELRPRLDRVIDLLAHQLEVMKLSREVGQQTREHIDQYQREYFLREQLKTIREELGEDGGAMEVEELREAIAKAGMPEEARSQCERELARLEAMPEASTEFAMVRSYLDWMLAMPWAICDAETIDIASARQILDQDHYGLDKIKRRILEYLAVRKLSRDGHSPILCFVGPPGVGKTSLGQSIARALGLKFVRASLGGVHDEAEIRGHRRTYIGALPGTILQKIRKAGSRNPVFMLDELDKLGAGFHGDPASALLEVLDPEQNHSFQDHYLDVAFDLGQVFFIGTANLLENVPEPLRDRMEVIELAGYTADEKLQIARRYLFPRQLDASGLDAERVSVSDAALAALIEGYTREAGVRHLEREIGALLRHVAMRVAEGETGPFALDDEQLPAILGPPKFESEVRLRTATPGVATGLAWTPMGGDLLFIEASCVPGKGKLILTGKLGEVMKESAQAAVSLAKARLQALGVERQRLEDNDLHIHVPAGAIAKDGPSAGVAILVAVVSLLSNRTVRDDIAMTGEISLRGLVLPVGGIKEKVLAALRAGIHTVLLPARNRKDQEDIPPAAREQLQFVWLDDVDQAIATALAEKPCVVPASRDG